MVSIFSEKLKEDRRRLGYTQEKLAETMNVSTGAIQNWEAGKRLPYPTLLIIIENTLRWRRGYSLQLIDQG